MVVLCKMSDQTSRTSSPQSSPPSTPSQTKFIPGSQKGRVSYSPPTPDRPTTKSTRKSRFHRLRESSPLSTQESGSHIVDSPSEDMSVRYTFEETTILKLDRLEQQMNRMERNIDEILSRLSSAASGDGESKWQLRLAI